MEFIVLIPARYESSRFPGKPLAKIGGQEMILRVCRQVAKTGLPLAVATDNAEIAACVEGAGFKAVMTSPAHRSGTERVEEAYRNLECTADVVINVQGDEPFIDPRQILSLVSVFKSDPEACIATLARPFDAARGYDALEDPNLVKLVKGEGSEALYFSRSVIPFVRKEPRGKWPASHRYFTHIGIYGYKAGVLSDIVSLPASALEQAESLEQLRWLSNGYRIKVAESDLPTIGIDTPADLEEAERYLATLDKD